MPYSGRCGAVNGGFDKGGAAKSLILNDLMMHVELYLTPISDEGRARHPRPSIDFTHLLAKIVDAQQSRWGTAIRMSK
jgi:hypothetical protein